MLATANSSAPNSCTCPLSPFAFVERLVEGDTPVWHRWDGDIRALLQALTLAARSELSLKGCSGIDRHTVALRRKRMIWLLDRLAPESDATLFEPFRDHALGIYAWGRQLPP